VAQPEAVVGGFVGEDGTTAGDVAEVGTTAGDVARSWTEPPPVQPLSVSATVNRPTVNQAGGSHRSTGS